MHLIKAFSSIHKVFFLLAGHKVHFIVPLLCKKIHFSTPSVGKKSCATREKYLFSLVAQYTIIDLTEFSGEIQ